MLTTMKEMLTDARREGRAVGGFNIGNYETLLAVTRAAESLRQPVIVQPTDSTAKPRRSMWSWREKSAKRFRFRWCSTAVPVLLRKRSGR